MEGLSNILC